MFLSTSFIRFAGAGEASASKRKRDDGEPSSSGKTVGETSGETVVAEPAHKRVAGPEISLSGIRMGIRNLPEALRPLCIPRTALAQDIFELDNRAIVSNKNNPDFARKLWISKIDLLTNHGLDKNSEKSGENDRILLQSLIKGQQTVFDRCLQKTDHPALGPLFEVAALKENHDAFRKLLQKATETRYEVPLSTLRFVADCGRLDLLRQLLSISTISAEQKKAVWKNAVRQENHIWLARNGNNASRERLEALAQSRFNSAESELRKTREVLMQIRAGVPLGHPDDRNALFWWAVRQGHRGIVQVFAYLGMDVNRSTNEENRMLLHQAVEGEDTEIVKVLIDAGADAGAKLQNDETPLHRAVLFNRSENGRLLVDGGVDLNAKTALGHTPLHYAALGERDGFGELLLKAGANVNEKVNDGSTPLHYAIFKGSVSMVNMLLDARADVNARTIRNETPLFLAVTKRHMPLTRMLLEAGADPNIGDNTGQTPLKLAGNNPPLMQLLKEYGAVS